METPDCPACGLNPRLVVFENRDVEPMVSWIFCKCGTIYHDGKMDKTVFNADYRKEIENVSDCRERYNYVVRQYVPFVEELTYGRKFLGVGHTLPFMCEEMVSRGWFSLAIDLIANPNGSNTYISADFEKHNFDDNKFDFIHLAHVLECFENWKDGLRKARELLNELGVVLITTVGPQFVHDLGYRAFGHWKPKEKNAFIARDVIEREMEYNGMRLVTSRENMNKRFLYWNDNHLIFQRKK